MKKLVFLKCNVCGNIVVKLVDKGVSLFCCGQMMQEVNVNSTDAAVEKHVPVVEIEGKKVTVKVGEVEHPMTEAHLIKFIAIETKQGSQIKYLTAEDKPVAEFVLSEGDEFVAAYEYCNLHGLWKK